MTTAHELARLLLKGPDLPVIVAKDPDLEQVNGVLAEPYEPRSLAVGWWDGEQFHQEPAVMLC